MTRTIFVSYNEEVNMMKKFIGYIKDDLPVWGIAAMAIGLIVMAGLI